MRTCSFGLTSAVGTAISLAGTSRVPASSAKAPVGMARPSARTARCNLKLVLIGRLPELLLQPWEKLFWQVKLARQAFRFMPSISPATAASGVRRDKAALSSGCKSHPATAPAGSDRSSQGGNELAEAFGKRVTNW